MKDLARQMNKTHQIFEGSIKCVEKELQLRQTLHGGQCFRWKKLQDDEGEKWQGIFKHHIWTLSRSGDELKYKVFFDFAKQTDSKSNSNSKTLPSETCNGHTKDYFEDLLKDYLRLEENLEQLYGDWSVRDPNFKQSALKFYGIRVLKQDPVENIFSFICSTNNNITRITSMVEKLCTFYGEQLCEIEGTKYHDFPIISSLAEPGVEQKLRKEGFGYRARYLHESAVKMMELGGETWLQQLQALPYLEAKEQLIRLPGVGAKVADCICLMSLNHLEAIPVDTHVFQISQRYLPHLKSSKTVNSKVYTEIVNYFQNLYGKYPGWAHSVLFCADLRQFQSSDNGLGTDKKKGVKRKMTQK